MIGNLHNEVFSSVHILHLSEQAQIKKKINSLV